MFQCFLRKLSALHGNISHSLCISMCRNIMHAIVRHLVVAKIKRLA